MSIDVKKFVDEPQRYDRDLAKITDEGLFERLATAVLRQADPVLYARLSHPGMNLTGFARIVTFARKADPVYRTSPNSA